MTRLRVNPFESEDYDLLESPKEVELLNREAVGRFYTGTVHKAGGPAFTIVDPEERVVVCLGVHTLFPRSGETWAAFSKLAAGLPHVWIVVRSVFLMVWKDYDRFQALVDPRFPESTRLVQHLGYKPEGLMRRSGPHGEDRMIWSVVRERES